MGSGKWRNHEMFPDREFDDLDEYRAAKKQHAARRNISAQNGRSKVGNGPPREKWRSAAAKSRCRIGHGLRPGCLRHHN